MKIIKRDGQEVTYHVSKIEDAVRKANKEVPITEQLSDAQIKAVGDIVTKQLQTKTYTVTVEEIQDLVERAIMDMHGFTIAQKYIRYRYNRSLARKANTTDEKILSIIQLTNEEIKQENANKNPIIASTQRDYMAGEVSKDITERILLPKHIVDAHHEGIIHFHDADYFIQDIFNCCLINLEDMLQNGTVISETMIESPKSFYTACNIATQVIAQVSSNQFGGQTFTLSHLAPFVDVSRQKYRKQIREENTICGVEESDEIINKKAEIRLIDEIKRGIQTIQYQLITLMTTNGQAPFVTMFMYLDEVTDKQTKNDLALLIEEVLNQRIYGVKNEKGVLITPAFPKIIYVLDENNITEDSEFWYLTKLSAKCTAKRMVPDYISAKIMKKLKGEVYPCINRTCA